MQKNTLRAVLVAVAIEWHKRYGNAPSITGIIGELDAAALVECSDDEYAACVNGRSIVAGGYDFIHAGKRYQVKAGRASGREGSMITLIAKPSNFDWDRFVWIRYDKNYDIQEAWMWEVEDFKAKLGDKKRLCPEDMRGGQKLSEVHVFDRFGVFPAW